jgi:dimethylhistidine N-methyltransferase
MEPKLSEPPRFVQLHHLDREGVRAELARALMAPLPSVPPKFFYDPLGSRLFDAITELREYYPTRTEAQILARHGAEIARLVGRGQTLVDLGAGNCEKAGRLFGVLVPSRYVAVDISVEFLREALLRLQREHPGIPMLGVGLDFSTTLQLPPEAGEGPRTVFYPGSSIGNFTPDEALAFLRQARAAAAGGHLIIGVDLAKPASMLEAAYDDALGVTAAFNLNLLYHVNAMLGADFDVRDWQHVVLVNQAHSRVEMHLEARCALTVRWPGGERRFDAGQRIHTENSYKYRREDFEALLRDAGFTSITGWSDEQGWFAVLAAA